MAHGYRLGAVLLLLFVLPGQAPAGLDAFVKQAMARGVRYLRSQQGPDGVWAYGNGSNNSIGPTALAGLAMLECGVPAGDPAVRAASQAVRRECVGLSGTYAISLSIMFLDRLGDPDDVPLIQALGVRLIAGQDVNSGGWTYQCPVVGGDDERRWLETLARRGPGRRSETAPADKPRERPPLTREIQDLLNRVQTPGAPPQVAPGPRTGDNSNTQFALLGLWIARRNGVPADNALLRVAERFRLSQNPADGGWSYNPAGGGGSSPAMTCAGLLGLAVGHGVLEQAAAKADDKAKAAGTRPRRDRVVRDATEDPSIRAGLLALATCIGNPGQLPPAARVMNRGHYFLWSLERVAAVYGLETIGRRDWYGWGAEALIVSQLADGSWQGEYSYAGVDTSFALLFLTRANLAPDLTTALRGKVADPGGAVLRSGGVGGASLAKSLKPGIELGDKAAAPAPAAAGKEPAAEKPPEGTAGQLAAQLAGAAPEVRETLLRSIKDGKGVTFTQALAEAIPKLAGDDQKKARDALAERLARMSAATLRDKFQDDNPEIRQAAATACIRKRDQAHVPDLIGLLKDPDALVVRAARKALTELTDRDFGPSPDAEPDERDRAIAKWQEWWRKFGDR